MGQITFSVPGVMPGWQRAGKAGKRHYTQAQTASAEAEVAAHGRQAASGVMLSGPLRLDVMTFRPIPSSWTREKAAGARDGITRPTGKPDCDNIAKLIADALNGVCYGDDAQIVEMMILKWYAEKPETIIRLCEV